MSERWSIELARRQVTAAIRSGRLVRQPCEICGERRSEAHHEDYSRSLDVRWLCRKHHNQRHAELREAQPKQPSEARNLTFRTDKALVDELRESARRNGRSFVGEARFAIREYLAREEEAA